MDTYYKGSMMDEEDNNLERTNRGLNIDGNGAFITTLTVSGAVIATLAVSITLMAFLRLSSYVNILK